MSEQDASITFRIREFDGNGNMTGKFLNGVTAKLIDPSGELVYQTATSSAVHGADGWVKFSPVPTGRYWLIAYKQGLSGYWKQTDCSTTGTTTGATLQNVNTGGQIAGLQMDVLAIGGQTTFCRDIGLKNGTATTSVGRIHLRIREFDANGNFSGDFINGATVKLMTASGSAVLQTQTSAALEGQDGWVHFNDVPVGNYSIVAYKTGLSGYWKQTDCAGPGTTDNATIQNATTEGNVAGFTTNIPSTANQTSYCHDLGLKNGSSVAKPGSIKFRVREWDGANTPTGKFINGATVKLLDQHMTQIAQTATSSAVGSEDGWVRFDTNPGTYSVVVFKDGYEGVWRQTDCGAGGTTDNATVKNMITEDKVAAKQENIVVAANDITFCRDVALKLPTVSTPQGYVNFRVRQFTDGAFTGNFVNDAKVKLVDGSGNVIKDTVSAVDNGQDGWVHIAAPEGMYQILVYKTGMTGVWKQLGCSSDGSKDDVAIQNNNTENMVGAKTDVTIVKDTSVFCKDVGLQ